MHGKERIEFTPINIQLDVALAPLSYLLKQRVTKDKLKADAFNLPLVRKNEVIIHDDLYDLEVTDVLLSNYTS